MVQQIGTLRHDVGLALLHTEVGHGRGQVGLAAAIRPRDHQPALGLVGETLHDVDGPAQRPLLGRGQVRAGQIKGEEVLVLMQTQGAQFAVGGRGASPEVGRADMHPLHQMDVGHAAAQAGVHLLQALMGGDDCGQLGVVTMS